MTPDAFYLHIKQSIFQTLTDLFLGFLAVLMGIFIYYLLQLIINKNIALAIGFITATLFASIFSIIVEEKEKEWEQITT